MKIKINELTWRGMDKLNQLTRELKEMKEEDNLFSDIIGKEIEIYKLITDINSKYATKKQIECEINV